MSQRAIIDPITQKNINIFLKSNFPCLALIGPVGSGKTFIAEYITAKVLDPATNKSGSSVITLDAKTTGIDDVRDLQKSLKLTTYGNKKVRRVVVINNFESFGHEAQNSLLKTLEEPPLDTMIIITINNESKVLQTIYSRVKTINIRPISKSLTGKTFSSEYSESEINRAYSLSMGQAGLLVSLLQNSETHKLVQAIALVKELLKKPKMVQIAEVDKIIKNKDLPVDVFLDGLFRIFNASYGVAVQKNKNEKTAYNRLISINECISDVQLGLNKKLALTRLFLKI